MTQTKWRGILSSTGRLDATSETVSLDECLNALWDYIGIQRSKVDEDMNKLSKDEMDAMTRGWISNFLKEKMPKVEGYVNADKTIDMKRLYAVLENTLTGYDVIQQLIDDKDVTEIQINSYNSIWAERKGKVSVAIDKITGKPLEFRSPEACLYFINTLLQVTKSQMDNGVNKCLGNAITPEGYRVAAYGPAAMAADKGKAFSATKSPACVIRKFSDNVITVDNLVSWYSMSDQMAGFISLLGDNHASVAVAGETGSGKTVNLQSVIDSIGDGTRAISMEKDSELRLRHFDAQGRLINNVLQLEYINEDKNITYSPTSNTAVNLFNQAMRATPRTIIFGEVRSNEEIGLVMTAAAAGHNVMFTVHSDSAEATIKRLTNAMSSINPGQQKADIVEDICSTIDIVIVPAQVKDGTRKVLEITEVCGCKVENGIVKPILNPLYVFKQTGYVNGKVYGEHVQLNNITPELLNKWSRKGIAPEVREFLTMPIANKTNGDPGTYYGERSPYRHPPGFEDNNNNPKSVSLDSQMKIKQSPPKSSVTFEDLFNEFEYGGGDS